VKKILILNTGGTIGMTRTEKGYMPDREYFRKALMNMDSLRAPGMPAWDLAETEELLDSSNMTVRDWNEIAKILADAEAYKLRVVKEVAADSAYFNEIFNQYSKNKQATLVSLFSDTLAEAIAPVQDKFIVDVKGGGQSVLWLKVNQEPLQQRAASAPAGAGSGSGEEKK
jgi:hypothetical protein